MFFRKSGLVPSNQVEQFIFMGAAIYLAQKQITAQSPSLAMSQRKQANLPQTKHFAMSTSYLSVSGKILLSLFTVIHAVTKNKLKYLKSRSFFFCPVWSLY